MAAPTDPTLATIVSEAFKKVNIDSPSSAKTTRGQDYFCEEVKDDIWRRKDRFGRSVRYKTLQSEDMIITTVGISKYDWPSDFDELISISFLDGTHTGTASAGAAGTITLESGEDASESDVVGNYILFTGGTGAKTYGQITTYSTSTLIATPGANWSTAPSTDTTYRIINNIQELEEEGMEDMGTLGTSFSTGDPNSFAKIYEDENDRYILDKAPDASTYGLLVRYYVNIHKIDLAGTLMTKIYRNWRDCLVYGVATKIAESEDDSKYAVLKGEYEARVSDLIAKEVPYSNQFEGFTL